MFKRIISTLIISFIFLYPAMGQLAGMPLTINLAKTEYGPNEEIKAPVTFTNFMASRFQGSLICSISSVNRDLPPAPQLQPLDLAPSQKSTLTCSMYVGASMKPGVYSVDAEVRDSHDQVVINTSRQFIITGTTPQIEAELEICPDQACQGNKAVFTSGQTVFLKLRSAINDLEITSTLKDSQGGPLPAVKFTNGQAQIKTSAAGSFIVSLVLKKTGWQDTSLEKNFAVIAAPAKIVTAAICKVDGKCNGQETAQNCPQDCAITKNKTGSSVYLILFIVILVLFIIGIAIYIKKIRAGSDSGISSNI